MLPLKPMLKLLFVCTHNRCRSILAEAIFRDVAGDVFDVRSAGSQPAGVVFPGTLSFLQQQGIKTDDLRSQSWDEFADFAPDVVITVCDSAAGEACPLWMGNSIRVHWGLTDPSKESDAEKQQALFSAVADTLRQRIERVRKQDFSVLSADDIKQIFTQAAGV